MSHSRRVSDYVVKNEFLQKCAISGILVMALLSLPSLCQSHDPHERPSFKYSAEANLDFDPETAPVVHAHSHDEHDEHGHHHHGHDHHHHEHHDHVDHPGHTHKSTAEIIDIQQVWLRSIGSTLLISAAPFLLLSVIPLDNSEAMKPRLKVLLSFASGGLLGDAFLHLIPHAVHPHTHHGHNEHGHEHHHDQGNEHEEGHAHGHDMTIGLWVLGGIIAFLSVELLVRNLKGSGSHSHCHGPAKPQKIADKKKNSEGKQSTTEEKPKKKTSKAAEVAPKVEVAGYLNLAADFAHNFTDGLAIGASYLAGNSIGVVTTITILLHEVPHEIGDFAILIKSGCSRRKAMLLQLVTALGALAGTVLALAGASSDAENNSANWVLPFTAGGFIYISTVSILPELLEETTKLKQSLKEILALLAGVGLMILIGKLE